MVLAHPKASGLARIVATMRLPINRGRTMEFARISRALELLNMIHFIVDVTAGIELIRELDS